MTLAIGVCAFVVLITPNPIRMNTHPVHICGRYLPVLLTIAPANMLAGARADNASVSTPDRIGDALWIA
jgi:hypothetical protein